MSDQWLCLIDGQKLGPLEFAELQQLAEAGRLKPDDYVRHANDEQWKAAKDIDHLLPAPPVTQDRAEVIASRKNRSSGPQPGAQAIIEPAVAASSIPRGKTVAIPPPVESAPPPLGSEAPFFISDTKPGESGIGLLERRRKKKSNHAMPLMIGGAAVVGLLALMVVLVLGGVIDFSGPAASAAAESKMASPAKPSGFDDEESNPTDPDGTTQAVATSQRHSPKKNALLASVTQFLDVTKRYRSNGRQAVQVNVTGLWLSADEQGEPYVGGGKGDAEQTPSFLVIKLQTDNAPGAAPVKCQGWRAKAVLFDDAGEPIEPLAPDESAEPDANQPLEPGGSLEETLVFPLATVEFERLRLVLPHESVGIKDNRSFGLELPRHALGRGLDGQGTGSPTGPVNAREASGDASPLEIVDKDPAPMPPAKAAPANPKDDLEALLKQLDAKAKQRDEAEKKK